MKKKSIILLSAALLVNCFATAQNKLMITDAEGKVHSFSTTDVTSVGIMGNNVSVQPQNQTFSAKRISFENASKLKIIEAEGWQESAYAKWSLLSGATSYHVYVSGGNYSDYTLIDQQLVRNYGQYGRADVVGLKPGTYKLRVVPVVDGSELTAKATETQPLQVTAYNREGFAHFKYDKGVGAYNNDGTLKSGAVVIYVTAKTAKTVTAKLSSGVFTGLQAILAAYEKGNVTTPLDVRIIGLLQRDDLDATGSSAEGLQIKGRKADSELNITIEGIGDDATIKGFGFLVRNTASLEMRNLGILRAMDDGISLDTDNAHIWLHNIDVFYGKQGSGDHAKGDGSIDVKSDSKYVTVAYCHFWDTGKSSMCGMKSESGPNYITYHHNWFDHSDSRHARVRTMSVHLYNNYYDGVAKYGMGATMGSSLFAEANYFRHAHDPFLISGQGTDAKGTGTFSGEQGGMIKGYGNVLAEQGTSSNYLPVAYSKNNTQFDYYDASTREEQVPATVKTVSGGNTYNNFDTNSDLMYSYTPDDAQQVPDKVTGNKGAGRLGHGDLQYAFNNSKDDADYNVNAALAGKIDGYKSALVGFFEGGSVVVPGDSTTTDTTKTDTTKVEGEMVISFEGKKPSDDIVTVTGNYSTSKGTATWGGKSYTTCVKMESTTSMAVNIHQPMEMTLVFGDKETASAKLNGEKIVATGSTYTTTVSQPVTITKDKSVNLFVIVLKPAK